MTARQDPGLPDWLAPLESGARAITADELTRFVPPEGSQARRGAVLLLFGEGPAGPDLLLTERAHGMRSHPGQISFPGGSLDPTDASPIAAALREAEEETGVDPAGVEVVTVLPSLYLPPANFVVAPVVGWWAAPSPIGVRDPAEVHDVLSVPVGHLLDPEHRFSVTHPTGYVGAGFELDDLLLWGFTAGLLSSVLELGGLSRPWDAERRRPVPERYLGGGRG